MGEERNTFQGGFSAREGGSIELIVFSYIFGCNNSNALIGGWKVDEHVSPLNRPRPMMTSS